ncbi:hypothetical protein [Streptomyces sp900116325]|uniref:hypothetical protein n=1 Tax=Streptomyces sp. 900116325 TaxID=3154295 RepID=UPI0033D6E3E4
MAEVIADHDFLTCRPHEWTLLTIALGKPWAAEELTNASDWCQRVAATIWIEALRLLAARTNTPRSKRSEPSVAGQAPAQLP